MSAAITELPRWDLESIFPGIKSPQFQLAWEQTRSQLEDLQNYVRTLLEGEASFYPLVEKLNVFGDTATLVQSYLYLLTSANTADAEAQAKLSELEMVLLDYRRLRPRITQFFAALDESKANLGDYAILVEEAKLEARHLMSEAEEVLAAELTLSGGSAWAKLHGNLTSQISGTFDGQDLPVTALRNLAFSTDEAVRKSAFEVELAVWKRNDLTLAATLNGYKGEIFTLNQKRGWEDDLAPTLLDNRITRKTLAAMQNVMVSSFPHWRRYFALKAKTLGKPRLDWWDLFAPLPVPKGHTPMRWDWEAGRDFIIQHLAGFSQADSALAARAYREAWIDAPPRKGKVGGAYCMSLGKGLSRILTNYEESFDSVTTMAHELGHAYHNHCLREVPYLIRQEPMTLAETASIMNETIVGEAALEVLPLNDQIVVLEGGLQGAAQVIVDIHSRFLFETALFAKRRERELSAEEMCELMTQAQRQTYGEGLASYHPYMWAVKGHYYGSNFYNYPYAFGLLFGLSLFKQFQQQGPEFVARYDQLLASVGMYSANHLAQRFGFNLEAEIFWQGGMDVLVERINRLEELLE